MCQCFWILLFAIHYWHFIFFVWYNGLWKSDHGKINYKNSTTARPETKKIIDYEREVTTLKKINYYDDLSGLPPKSGLEREATTQQGDRKPDCLRHSTAVLLPVMYCLTFGNISFDCNCGKLSAASVTSYFVKSNWLYYVGCCFCIANSISLHFEIWRCRMTEFYTSV